MKSGLFLRGLWVWTYVWQSTIFVTLGLWGSFVLKHRSSRAHQVLLLSMTGAVIVPVASILVKYYELGVFIAEPVMVQPSANDWAPIRHRETSEIVPAGSIDMKRPQSKKTPRRSWLVHATQSFSGLR
jgi:hypothetical protein